MRQMSARLLLVACLSGSIGSGAALAAGPNLVLNGGFEQTLVNASSEFGTRYPSQQVTNWTSTGYNFVFKPGTADSGGATSEFGSGLMLWGPNNGSANGLPSTSPSGGNFIAADGAFSVGAISQTITGIAAGQTVDVSFYWAGAQQYSFDGATTEKWQVSLGSSTQSTTVVNNVNHGFTGWVQQTFRFVASVANPVLSFLAVGTPSGQPPFALLDGVSAVVVPEPTTLTILLSGVAGLFGLSRRRRQ